MKKGQEKYLNFFNRISLQEKFIYDKIYLNEECKSSFFYKILSERCSSEWNKTF